MIYLVAGGIATLVGIVVSHIEDRQTCIWTRERLLSENQVYRIGRRKR